MPVLTAKLSTDLFVAIRVPAAPSNQVGRQPREALLQRRPDHSASQEMTPGSCWATRMRRPGAIPWLVLRCLLLTVQSRSEIEREVLVRGPRKPPEVLEQESAVLTYQPLNLSETPGASAKLTAPSPVAAAEAVER